MARKGIFGAVEVGAGATALGQVREINRPKPAAELDATVMNPNGEGAIIPGATTRRLEMSVLYEQSDAGMVALRAAQGNDSTPTQIIYYPEGKVSGKASLTGSYFILEDNLTQSADGLIEEQFVAVSDGSAETEGTVP